MSAIRALPWQQAAWSQLTRARTQSQLSHAWLVSGTHGVGKRAVVAALVASLLCEHTQADGSACGDCKSCKMLLAGGHPDAHLLCLDGHLGLAANASLQREDGITHWQPDKASKRREISIDGVRSLIEGLGLASHRQGNKVAVIAPAEDLSRASADALLKTIEEPTANTFVVLIADQALSLSATLRSRCQQLRLGLPPPDAALDWLQTELPAQDRRSLQAALDLARGAPLTALAQLQDSATPPAIAWRAALDAIASGRGDPMKLAAEIDDDTAIAFLHCCQGWLADRLRAQLGTTAALNGTRVAELNRELHDAHRRLDSNTRAQLVMEAMLIGWVRLLASQAAPSPQSPPMQSRAR